MKIFCLFLCLIASFSSVLADDLYKVFVKSQADAAILRSADAEPVYQLNDGYLVLLHSQSVGYLQAEGLAVEFLEADITAGELAMEYSDQGNMTASHEVLYEIDDLRLFRVPSDDPVSCLREGLAAIDNSRLKIEFTPSVQIETSELLDGVNLDSLINLIDQDSLESYVNALEAFDGRLAGTTNAEAASDWIKAKFESFGYSNASFDEFTGYQLWSYSPVDCRNVVAVKTGSVYPDRQIVVGAHHDAVPGSPGSDDNGSGTAGVLEIARVLADIETEMTFVFATFDSEESGLWGARHYANAAVDNGDDILFMMNMDMIANYQNDAYVSVYYGPQEGFADLWNTLADSLVGIGGIKEGVSTRSDHAPFVQVGYDVVFIIERIFSPVYHTYRDSTTYMNFDYMKRLVQASLATTYTVNLSVPPIKTTGVYDGGDGQSLQVTWEPREISQISLHEVYYSETAVVDWQADSVANDSSSYIVEGLTEGTEYMLYVLGVDGSGNRSIVHNHVTGTPWVLPPLPADQAIEPLMNGIRLEWSANNTELDFDHYTIYRDGTALPDVITSTFFEDYDPLLASDLHQYLVVAVDADGFESDTVGIEWLEMRAATLDAGRILVVNRTSTPNNLCDSTLTRDLLLEAVTGLDYDYIGDPSGASTEDHVSMVDMISYELVVIGAETGKGVDDIGQMAGLLDDLEYYLSFGGKAVVFGRWGDVSTLAGQLDTINYVGDQVNGAYAATFNTNGRIFPLTSLVFSPLGMDADLIGSRSLVEEYPHLVWDSLSAAQHNGSFTFKNCDGIPCPSIPILGDDVVDILYSYDSQTDSVLTEGQPMAWRYLGGSYEYVWFDLPLTFMGWDNAVFALKQAIGDLGLLTTDDLDGDGVADDTDNCRFAANAGQEDTDTDGVGDACDLCADFDDLVDNDGDYVPDGCDLCPGYNDLADGDSDGNPDSCDICPGYDDFADNDSDSFPDSCDNCPDNPNPLQKDNNPADPQGNACCCGIYSDLPKWPPGYTGNLNCSPDGKRTLSDVTSLIDNVYISKEELCCPASGNTNGSWDDGDCKMTLSDVTKLIDAIFLSKNLTEPCLSGCNE